MAARNGPLVVGRFGNTSNGARIRCGVKLPLAAKPLAITLAAFLLRGNFKMTNDNIARPHREGCMKTLSAHRLRKLISYDRSTGIMRWLIQPNARIRIGSEAGHHRRDGRWKVTIEGRSYLRNRLAVLAVTGLWPPKLVLHRNGDLSDDRWVNLVVA